MKLKNICGKKLKTIRKEKKMTLDQAVADMQISYGIKIDRSALGRIEQQNRSITDIELLALIEIYETSLEDIFSDFPGIKLCLDRVEQL